MIPSLERSAELDSCLEPFLNTTAFVLVSSADGPEHRASVLAQYGTTGYFCHPICKSKLGYKNMMHIPRRATLDQMGHFPRQRQSKQTNITTSATVSRNLAKGCFPAEG